MQVLDAQALRKSIGVRTLLDGVTFTIEDGERVGLVGPNGCGKSTLAKILAGLDPPDGGALALRKGARVLYLDQEPTFAGDPTALEGALEGLSAWQAARRRHEQATEQLAATSEPERWLAEMESAAAEVERLGGWERSHEAERLLRSLGVRDLGAKVATMSGGERRRVALARLLVARPDLAILDEPTNHLDVEAIEWLERYLASEHQGAVLLVTHDRWFLNQVVTRTLEIERGTLHSYEGGWEEYLEAKAERLALADRTEQNRQNLLRKELAWLRRTPAARTGKQKARIHRAEATIADRPPPKGREVELKMDAVRSGRTLLDFEHLVLARGERVLIDDLTLSLVPGARIGVVGPNGCGKSSLLAALLGTLAPAAGAIRIGQTTQIAYLDQHRSGLDPEKTVAENVSPGASRVEWAGRPIELVSYLERMLFDAHQQRQPVRSLSGGERARVLLAKLLLRSANLLVLDEPTNDLDAPTLAALEELLEEFEGSALVVTHDRWFLERVATAILAFEGEGRVTLYQGNYSTWRALSARAAADAPPRPAAVPKSDLPKNEPPKKKGLTFAEKRELEGLMPRIEQIESELAALEAELADPTLYAARGGEVPQKLAAKERAQAQLAGALARWEELEARAN